MKKINLFYLALATIPLFTACSEELTKSEEPAEGTPVTFTIGEGGAVTRTVTTEETSGYNTVFTANESVGIYATGAATATNAKFTVSEDGNKLESSNPITIASSGNAKFTAYSPYSTEATDTYQFTIQSDQTTADNFNASNLLTATKSDVSASSPTVSLTFQPRLAILRIEMTGTLGLTTSAVKAKAKGSVTWTMSTDAVSDASGADTDIMLYHQVPSTTDEITSQVFTAFVPAQEIAANSEFLIMTVGEKQYRFTPRSAFSLLAGKINKIKVNINANGDVQVESMTINVQDWEVNELDIEGDLEEIVPEPAAAIELISTTQGKPTAETALNACTGIRVTKEGWNKVLLTTATESTIAFDITTAAFKIANDAKGKWYQKALVYRTADGVGSLGKYTLKFKVMTDEGFDLQMRIMRGQQSKLSNTDDPDTFFCIGTNTYGQTNISTTTKDAENNDVKGQWLNKSFTIDLSKLGTNATTAKDATMNDLAHGIAVVIACKVDTEAQNIYIKDLTFIEQKETAAQ